MRKKWTVFFWIVLAALVLASCGSAENQGLSERDKDISPDLEYKSSMELEYAEEFAVDYY